MPTVSIILPLHNRAGELPMTIRSVLAQTFKDWELLIVDDHSTDGADRVAREFADLDVRIRVDPLPDPKRGAPAARNLGTSIARGEYLIYLDSDDLLAPDALEHRVAFLSDRPSLDFCVSRCQLFRDEPDDIPILWNADTGEDDLDRLLKMDVPWQTTGPTWRRTSLASLTIDRATKSGEMAQPQADPARSDTAEIWDESVPSGQDWEFHIRAVASGLRFERVDRVDCHWRIATVNRDSIGKTSFGIEHARARPIVVRKMYDFLQSRKLLTEQRQRWFAAMYFAAADTIAYRVSRVEGRNVWREAFDLRLVDRKQWKQGDRYLFCKRWHVLAERKRQHIERTWPPDLLPQRGRFFNTAPVDPNRAPTVSVVMSVLNQAAHVRESVQSILGQTFRDFEFVIIDQGSTDGTAELLKLLETRDCRIRLSLNSRQGPALSKQSMVTTTRGKFIAHMDGSDVAHPLRLERQVDYLHKNPECVAVGTRVMLTDPLDVDLVAAGLAESHLDITDALQQGQQHAIVFSTLMLRRQAVVQMGEYDAALPSERKVQFGTHLARLGQLRNVADILQRHRQSTAVPTHQPTAETPAMQICNWGWNALRQRNVSAARLHAWRAILTQPLNLEAWHLGYRAFLGR